MEKREQYVTSINSNKDAWKCKIPAIKLVSYLELITNAPRTGVVRLDAFRTGYSIICECTEEEYRKFMEVAEKYYPRLCRYDNKVMK
jgi:hypothetical protein